LLGLVLWACVLQSGVHATLAGVITALFVPLSVPSRDYSPVEKMEHDLHPWVVFLILPLFGFANAGVPFEGMGLNSFTEPVTLGIILGLTIGKQLGIFSMLVLAIKSGLCLMPEGTNWRHLYGLSVLCGIGFTMSLFIGGLAFEGLEKQAEVRLGVLTASLISAVLGYFILRINSNKT
jgi:NhaA family Na+:H+ antiporter